MKNENLLNNNVSEQNKKDLVAKINTNLDNMGVLVERIEAFNQLINMKLDEVKDPHTDNYKGNDKVDNLAVDIYAMQNNINNYIMLSYSISDMTTKLNDMIKDTFNNLEQID